MPFTRVNVAALLGTLKCCGQTDKRTARVDPRPAFAKVRQIIKFLNNDCNIAGNLLTAETDAKFKITKLYSNILKTHYFTSTK